MSTILSFHGISKSYGAVQALREVSFEVPAAEVFGLLGPNGAGKTTLIRILMDIIRADEGSIDFEGRPMTREDLDRVGYLPEERGLYKKQKVMDVLTYFGELKGLSHGDARRRAGAWLEKVGLPETATWNTERLSKGMAQKIQIAATLLYDPPLAILDEPFSGLDPVNVRLVQELLEERGRAGLTTILSTHQMNLVEAVCDRVALIDKGRLMVYGGVQEVRERWSRPEVLVAVDEPPPAVAGVVEQRPDGDGCWRLLLADDANPGDILGELVRAGARIQRFEKVLTPMEDVFINVVKGVQP